MSNAPWDRVAVNPLEKPLSSDIDQLETYWHSTLLDLLYNQHSSRISYSDPTFKGQPVFNGLGAAFVGAGFMLGVGSGLVAHVLPGHGFFSNSVVPPELNLSGLIGMSDLAQIKPLFLSVAQDIALAAADPTNPRVDLVEVKLGRRYMDSLSRDVLNTTTGQFVPTLINKTLSYALDGQTSRDGTAAINVKTGTPAGSPVAPGLDAGYVKLGELYVPANAVSLDASKISDFRRMFLPNGILRVSGTVLASNAASPTLESVIAPPGVKVGVRVFKGGGHVTAYGVTVVCGDAFLFASGAATAFPTARVSIIGTRDAGTLSEDGTVDPGVYTVGDANIPTVADLIDPTKTANALSIGPNQRIIYAPLDCDSPVAGPELFRFELTAQY